MGRPESIQVAVPPKLPCKKAALRQAEQPACPDNGGKPGCGWQGKRPSHRICLKVTAPAALCRACINPRLAAKVRFGHTLSHCICIL